MKTIGIVGVTAEGAADCYKKIVKLAGESLQPNQHPEIILVNPSFDSILDAQLQRNWQTVADIIAAAAQKCITAGADFIIMPANSVHFAYDLIAGQLTVPVLNIVDEVADACVDKSYKKVSVLGVGLTMTYGLYDHALEANGIGQVRLSTGAAKRLDEIIYSELVMGKIRQTSVEEALRMCSQLQQQGCEALVLACTELQMILNEGNVSLPIIDSTAVLAASAVAKAL